MIGKICLHWQLSAHLHGQASQDAYRIRADRLSYHDELDHIEPALAAFVFGDERLRFTNTVPRADRVLAGFLRSLRARLVFQDPR